MQRLLEANGWTATVGGKHQVKMTKPGYRPITLPMNHGRDYPVGPGGGDHATGRAEGRDE